MKTIERKALAKLIENARTPSVPGAELTRELGRVELHTPLESIRLLRSNDFRKGWELCHHRFAESLQYIVGATDKQLKDYVKG
jgi:hypothetical protein